MARKSKRWLLPTSLATCRKMYRYASWGTDCRSAVARTDLVAQDRRFELLVTRCRRAVDEVGAAHGVKVRHTLAAGDAVDRISEMCLERGPWNIVALARMPASAAIP